MRWGPLLLCALVSSAECVPAAEQGPVFSIVEENDAFADRDRHYTQGAKLSYLQADNHLPHWSESLIDMLPGIGLETENRKFGYTLGQSIFTPADIKASALVPTDRPYAGWLYAGLILQRRGTLAERWAGIDHLELNVGAVGEASFAEEAQRAVHGVLRDNLPKGWDNQLESEPGIALKYVRAVRFSPCEESHRYFDFIPHAGVSLGNVDTSLRLGGIVRFGINLPDDFGPQTIDSLLTTHGGRTEDPSESRYGAYLLAGVEGRAVFFNTFLDGNICHSSHSVDREPLVAEFRAGAVFVLNRFDLGIQYILRTQEFVEQSSADVFGSLYLKYRF